MSTEEATTHPVSNLAAGLAPAAQQATNIARYCSIVPLYMYNLTS